MSYTELSQPTPKIRGGVNQRKGVLLHHTASFNLAGDVAWLTGQNEGGSCHVVIGLNGERVRLASDRAITWHAGKSAWRGKEDCNAWMLGVEFVGDTNVKPLTDAQLESFWEWYQPRAAAYKLTVADVTDHRTVAQPAGRKSDLLPSELKRVLDYIAAREAVAP
jgi:N-acetyl-anhydromuramyl-L-alanine amidase AmpD